ncbi:MAG: phosphoenolpyruvate--protein phosphotransferase [Phycisphaerales bacterium]|nr:phosphoenolpyruvate--protein phosphotransferase [Phycisphaerales bacterium]
MLNPPMKTIQGIAVAPGIEIASAFVLEQFRQRVPHHIVVPEERAGELERFEQALQSAMDDLAADRDRAARDLSKEAAKIFEFHLGLLQDPTLLEPIRDKIGNAGTNADFAVASSFSRMIDQFNAMGSQVFRDKARDVLDLERRILDHLMGRSQERLSRLEGQVVLIAHELTPTQAASLGISQVVGLATDAGGRTDHTSIMAAALGIPVVVGCHAITEHVNDGDLIILDGRDGQIIIDPDEETLEVFRKAKKRLEQFLTESGQDVGAEAITKDGTKITLLGNIEFPHEVEQLLKYGGEGVGLYRTEFLYLISEDEPTEEELYEQYVQSLELLAGRTLTIRTLDLGADKHTQQQALEPERNPFLGLRSIRYSLQHLPMFRRQLRAILRAAAVGPLRIMFPLITTMTELKQARMILSDVADDLRQEGVDVPTDIPIGMMIEVPSAALMASTFTREVDFFSIGTNDLIQYTVAVDRSNERVANLYSASNPAVIRLVKNVIRAAKRRGVDTSLCGEIAGDITYTMLLIGLGLRSLSLVPAQIPRVKQVIRRVTLEECERLARKVGAFESQRRILRVLREETRRVLPEADGGWNAD